MQEGFPIRVAANRSGLSTHVIRMWEKRHNVVTPRRSETGRRLYNDSDVEKLTLLREATELGHSISSLAQASVERLRAIIEVDSHPTADNIENGRVQAIVNDSLEAISALNETRLTRNLETATLDLGFVQTLERVVGAIAREMGERWESGTIRSSHEHFATSIIKNFIQSQTRPYSPEPDAPRLVVATPIGQLHELGATMVTGAASAKGWAVTYLGPSLAASEIAAAVRQVNARALAISVVYPGDDNELSAEFRQLRRLVPANLPILFGGRMAARYEDVIHEINGQILSSLVEIYPTLEQIRLEPRQFKKPDPNITQFPGQGPPPNSFYESDKSS